MGRGSKPGEHRGGRVAGTPNKKTQAVIDRLEELGCDPLELSAKIAKGEELDGPHPKLEQFRALANVFQLALQDAIQPAHLPGMTAMVLSLTELIENSLTRGYVPIDLRSKHISDLMQYVHPKRKAVEVSGEVTAIQEVTLDTSTLETEVLEQILNAVNINQLAAEAACTDTRRPTSH